MGILKTKRLEPLGVELVDCDAALLLSDEVAADEVLDLLAANGVILVRDLHLDDAQQVAFSRKLGPVVDKGSASAGRGGEFPEIFKVSLDPAVNNGPYMKSTVFWHLDGATDEIPPKGSLLTARVVSGEGGHTQFASTYAAYDRLADDERRRLEQLRCVHTVERAHRLHDPNPDPEVLARVRSVPPREQPLVWHHHDGRRSLVLGATATSIVGMSDEVGAALLEELLMRATPPEAVLTHEWSVGDLVIWDNRGLLHRATPYGETSGRRMHRVTLEGDEPITAVTPSTV